MFELCYHNSVNIYIGLLLTGLSYHNSINNRLLLAELCCHNLVNDTEHIKHIINVFRHTSVIVLRCSTTYTLKKLSVSLQLSNVQIDCKSAIFCQNAVIGQRGNRYSVIVFTIQEQKCVESSLYKSVLFRLCQSTLT